MPIAAISQHPEGADATAEVIGQALEDGGSGADLVVLFTSAHHRDEFAEIAATVRAALEPGRLIGVTAGGIMGGAQEIEDGPAVALWAAQLGTVPNAVRLTAASTPAGTTLQGLPHPAGSGSEPQTLLLLADPFSVPVPDVLDVLAAGPNPMRVIGGLASAGMSPGTNRLVLDDEVFDDGSVGVLFDDQDIVEGIVVSQGCRPVGSPMIVTKAEGMQVMELAGQSAISRLEQLASSAPPDDRGLLASGGVHLGVVADEHQADFGRGDFLVRSVVGADRETGALSVGALVEVGTTVQFHVRDAATADEDLRALLAGHRADGALVFTCNGRGRHLFGTPHHDARLVADIVSDHNAVAGMFCAGEIGPVGTRSFLHGFTACALLVTQP
ncbi:MAG TPA: FIST N-terminal domain-containing protein [Acidimicrobiales bacterium]|jgi:small ligand-binding sensory domain FIST